MSGLEVLSRRRPDAVSRRLGGTACMILDSEESIAMHLRTGRSPMMKASLASMDSDLEAFSRTWNGRQMLAAPHWSVDQRQRPRI